MYIITNLNIICITCLNVILSSYMHVSWNRMFLVNIKTYDITKKKMVLTHLPIFPAAFYSYDVRLISFNECVR